MKKLLLIEDDMDFAETLTYELELHKIQVTHLCELTSPLQLQSCGAPFHYAIIDLRLKETSGLDAIEMIRDSSPKAEITMLSAYGSISTTVEAMKRGSDNFLMKPCSIEEILIALKIVDKVSPGTDTISATNLHGAPPLSQQKLEAIPDLYTKEREYIDFVLKMYNGNISHAAKALGIARQSLQRKLKKYIPKG